MKGSWKHYGAAKVIAVDMPIALVEHGDRDADIAARAFLTGQSSSVFSSPPRPVLAAKDYDEARRISLRVSGKSISKQARRAGAGFSRGSSF